MVQVKCSCGRTATMSHPADWVCRCQVEALYEEIDRAHAMLKERKTDVVHYVQRDAVLLPATDG